MKNKILVLSGLTAAAFAFAAKDPVIMTVNGVDVPRSEFEYLYNKNSQQQLNPQTIDEYVEMFKLYKLKVADAKAEGLDTTAAFRKEMDQYRHDLAAPYLTDSTYLFQLLDEQAERAKQDVESSHIMLFKTRDYAKNKELRQRADSLRKVLLSGGDFAEIAKNFSQDRGSNSRGGSLGWIQAGRFPYAFEKAAYSLGEGEISEVVESPVGYHILKGGAKRPALGKVNVQHILVLTQNKDAAAQARAKETIDSLYSVVTANPESFGEVARKYSEDPGSARQEGKLPLFGPGEMVPEFEAASFALKDNEISSPVKTSYGWHIIRRLGSAPAPGAAELKPRFLSMVGSPQDPRHDLIREHQTARLAAKHKGSLNAKTIGELKGSIAKAGIDSVFMETWSASPKGDLGVVSVGNKNYPVSEMLKPVRKVRIADAEPALEYIDRVISIFFNKKLVEAEEETLYENEPDYRNLLREYVDGSLLYEVSVKKVWDKAAKDTEGLENYFNRHRAEYAWKEPRVKGWLVQASNDSVASLVRKRAAEFGKDTLANTLRKEFPRVISVTKVLEPKGANAMVDNIVFNGPKVEPASSNFKVYFMIDPRVLNEPEDVNDVKGMVTSDYQNEFQNIWEEELRKKYPVKVNEKVLKQVRKQFGR